MRHISDETVIAAVSVLGRKADRCLLRQKGLKLGQEKYDCLYLMYELQVPRKRYKKISSSVDVARATQANIIWGYNFTFDVYTNRQKLKCLTVVDEYTRGTLAIDVAGSIRLKIITHVLS
jgi:putative transposase